MVLLQLGQRDALLGKVLGVLDLVAHQFLRGLGQILAQAHLFGDKAHDVEVGLALEQRVDALRLQVHMVVVAAHDRVLDGVLELAAHGSTMSAYFTVSS